MNQQQNMTKMFGMIFAILYVFRDITEQTQKQKL